MEWIELRVFVEVARCGSMSQAAAALHMGQPTVSQRVRSLETAVGRPLFTRLHRGVALTEAGQALLGHAERTLTIIEEGLSAARNVENERLHIRIAAPPSINSFFLGPLVRRLADGGQDVTLLDAHSHDVIQGILDGTIDAGFVLSSPPYSGLRLLEIGRDPLVCVISPRHRLAHTSQSDSFQVQDFAGERMIWYRYSRLATQFREEMERAIGSRCPWIETTPADTVKSLVLDNFGIGFLPRLAVEAELKSGQLLRIPLPGLTQEAWRIQLVHRDRKTLARPLQVLLNVARELWPHPRHT